MDHAIELNPGDVVQIGIDASNPQFIGCLMVVTEPKSWGAQGYVTIPGQGDAYYCAPWEDMEFVGHAPVFNSGE